MSSFSFVPLEARLREAGRNLRYPRTPQISTAVRRQVGDAPRRGLSLRMRLAAAIAALLIVAFAVPEVRAGVLEFIQLGIVRIFPSEPTATPGPSGLLPSPQIPRTATPGYDVREQPPYTISIAGLAGETTLEQARTQIPFEILLPSSPRGLGPPDRVFVQEDGPMVILVWLDEENADRVRMSLHEIGPRGYYIDKYAPQVIQEAEVNGEHAIWAKGPYLVSITNGHEEFRRLVEGNTLIWTDGEITYRLESALTLPEAIAIAESLQ